MPSPVHGPLENRQNTLIIPLIVFSVVSVVFVVWRLWIAWSARRKLAISDYLITLAAGLNVCANIFSIMSAFDGQGRHVYDPSLTPAMLVQCLKYIYVAQVTNVYGMLMLKASISSYLISLNFSKRYRIIIWISVGIVVVCNFMVPSVVLFGSCSPLSLRWDKKQPGHCWPKLVNSVSGYVQSGANIITDAMYSCAPLVYLSEVQLNKQTQWALRVVFLLALLGTACSVAKLTVLESLQATTDPTFDSVNLSIWSAAEVSAGIFAACLPPLRKAFDRIFRRWLPTSTGGSRSKSNPQIRSYELSKQKSTVNDYSSERSFAREDEEGSNGITKTVNVNVAEDESGQSYRNDFGSAPGSGYHTPYEGVYSSHVRSYSGTWKAPVARAPQSPPLPVRYGHTYGAGNAV